MQLKQFYNIATKASSRKKCYYFWWSTWLIKYNICSGGVFAINNFKLPNCVIVATECFFFATKIDRGSIMTGMYRRSMMIYSSPWAKFNRKAVRLMRWFRRRSKGISKLRVTDFCVGSSPVTSEFPAQRVSNAENVSIWWRHHEQHKTRGGAYYTSCFHLMTSSWSILD